MLIYVRQQATIGVVLITSKGYMHVHVACQQLCINTWWNYNQGT